MAYIDRTYITSWDEYEEFSKWADKTTFKCPNGTSVNMKDVYRKWNKDELENELSSSPEVYLMTTSWTLDYFLIKYCPIQFVQDRMKVVYGEEYYNSVKNGTSEYDTFKYPKTSKKFKIVFRDELMRRKNYIYKHKRRRKVGFWIEAEYAPNVEERLPLMYNEDLHRFVLPYELEFGEKCSIAPPKYRSVKAVIRGLRKMPVFKGMVITISGRYVGEELIIKAL